jgi:hypothetical protein
MFSPTTYFFVRQKKKKRIFLKKETKKRNFKRKEEKEVEWNVRAQGNLTSFVLVRFRWVSGTWLGSRSDRTFT